MLLQCHQFGAGDAAAGIFDAFAESDQRVYHVPCPDCGVLQPLRWSGITFDRTEDGRLVPDSVRYACWSCGALIDESQKPALLAAGVWVAKSPGSRTAGFHLNALYSPWSRWEEVVEKFLEAKDNAERLQVWVNTQLGETWEERAEKADPQSLEAHNNLGIVRALQGDEAGARRWWERALELAPEAQAIRENLERLGQPGS